MTQTFQKICDKSPRVSKEILSMHRKSQCRKTNFNASLIISSMMSSIERQILATICEICGGMAAFLMTMASKCKFPKIAFLKLYDSYKKKQPEIFCKVAGKGPKIQNKYSLSVGGILIQKMGIRLTSTNCSFDVIASCQCKANVNGPSSAKVLILQYFKKEHLIYHWRVLKSA